MLVYWSIYFNYFIPFIALIAISISSYSLYFFSSSFFLYVYMEPYGLWQTCLVFFIYVLGLKPLVSTSLGFGVYYVYRYTYESSVLYTSSFNFMHSSCAYIEYTFSYSNLAHLILSIIKLNKLILVCLFQWSQSNAARLCVVRHEGLECHPAFWALEPDRAPFGAPSFHSTYQLVRSTLNLGKNGWIKPEFLCS